MPFPRQRPDGLNETQGSYAELSRTELLTAVPHSDKSPIQPAAISNSVNMIFAKTVPVMARRMLFCGTAAAICSALVIQTAHAKPSHGRQAAQRVNVSSEDNLPGAWAWTTESQTYLRVRPSAKTPVVAKVPQRTKMFVWGKFNGWYRVETIDHNFGWVYHDELNCPKAHKIKQLSHAKAKLASAKSGHQTLYGSPEILKKYHARYKAPGAVRGLAKHGVSLAARPAAPKVAARVQIAKAEPLKAVAPKSRVAQPRAPFTRPTAPRVAANRVLLVETPRPSAMPTSSDKQTLTPTIPSAQMPSASNGFFVKRHASEIPGSRSERMPHNSRFAEANEWSRQDYRTNNGAAKNPVEAPLMVAAVETPAPNPATSTSIPVIVPVQAKAALQAAPQPAVKPVVRKVTAPKPVVKSVVAPVKPARKPVVKTAAKPAPKRLTRSQLRAQRRQRRLLASRKALQSRMGMRNLKRTVPPLATQNVPPISPDELMQAREAFLGSRSKSQPVAPSFSIPGGDVQPDENATPLFQPSSLQSNGINWDSEYKPFSVGSRRAVFTTADYNTEEPVTVQLVAQKSKPKVAQAAPSRGGSPRDYAAYAQSRGKGMATQALTYRGMPYIRGASSPNRGFDCSGLIYFLLRQRGYNPPRTAAGMASYGQPVSRDQLKEGDLVLFANTYKRGISHIGVYVGNNKFVHAANSNSGVRVDSLSSAYYARKYYGARRVK